ncbi:MAG: four helix bundle protein [Chitinophagaceae bacterium]|nr:four helix bundle protein [Chitinophagaceae bacterium]MBK8787901.1 four helix bundle protein [Chitinophagaceae bacterium]MBK9485117.1 four helix bundle protein [Chitinophagaceae bacterium]MBL0201548.1 four helix bundle protein [Chitinophagaceae bacterium]
MSKQNIILEKSYNFGLRTVKLYMHLRKNKVERELLIQFLKSGTSVGANVEEAEGGQSLSDFIHKIGIAYKEAREAHYWLRLLRDSELLELKLANSFIQDAEEIKKILASILKTSKAKERSPKK